MRSFTTFQICGNYRDWYSMIPALFVSGAERLFPAGFNMMVVQQVNERRNIETRLRREGRPIPPQPPIERPPSVVVDFDEDGDMPGSNWTNPNFPICIEVTAEQMVYLQERAVELGITMEGDQS